METIIGLITGLMALTCVLFNKKGAEKIMSHVKGANKGNRVFLEPFFRVLLIVIGISVLIQNYYVLFLR